MKKEVKELLSSKEMNLPYLREVKLKLPLQGNFNKLVNKIKEKGETVDSIFVDGFFAISKKDNIEKVTVADFYRTFHFDLNKDESEIEGYTYFGFLDKVSYKAKLDKKYNYLIYIRFAIYISFKTFPNHRLETFFDLFCIIYKS